MFTLLIFLSTLGLTFSAPLLPPSNDSDNATPALFGKEPPVCLNVARDRTKQDIVLSCIATIVACTWVSIHPNSPGPLDSWWAKAKRRAVTTIYAMIGPELVAFWAMRQWMAAGRIANEFNEKYGHRETKDKDPRAASWCKRAIYNLKGISVASRSRTEERSEGPLYQIPPRAWTRTHGFFIQMGGFMLCHGRTPIRVLQFDGLMEMIANGNVDIPDVTEDEINDKSKGDFFSKVFVVLQTTWFMAQCLARWATHLPVTELEVLTLAFAMINVVTCAVWWKKPQNVCVAIRIQCKCGLETDCGNKWETEEDRNRERFLRHGEEKKGGVTENLRILMNNGWDGKCRRTGRRRWLNGWLFGVPVAIFVGLGNPIFKMIGEVSDFNCGPLRVPMFWADHQKQDCDSVPLMVISVLFGAIHLIPWSYPFPSAAELWLWRSSALLITVEAPTLALYNLSWYLHNRYGNWLSYCLWAPIAMVYNAGAPFYISARLALIVLAFTTIRNLPGGACSSIEWTMLVPHV